MPLYDDLETRPVRLTAPEEDLSPILKEAFLQGTLGGGVGGGATRGAATGLREYVDPRVPYYDPHTGTGGLGGRDIRLRQMPHGPQEFFGLRDEFGNILEDWTGPDLDHEMVEGPASRLEQVPIRSRWRARVGPALKAGVRGMFNPVKIAADMLAGGTAGAGSAALGHAAGGGDRESAGLFTPPGEGYEGLVRAEDIERVIAQKELEKEAERQRLLEQYRASGYDLDPNTRLSELR